MSFEFGTLLGEGLSQLEFIITDSELSFIIMFLNGLKLNGAVEYPVLDVCLV